jgi:Na+-transporting methylmalonyl-CoA/oxaloacetate decarboxylase gamma subunit
MFGFLGFILIFILLIVFVVIALLGNLVRAIFGIGKRTPKHVHEETQQTTQQTSSTTNGVKKKIFAEDEGEYVEYEEVQ